MIIGSSTDKVKDIIDKLKKCFEVNGVEIDEGRIREVHKVEFSIELGELDAKLKYGRQKLYDAIDMAFNNKMDYQIFRERTGEKKIKFLIYL